MSYTKGRFKVTDIDSSPKPIKIKKKRFTVRYIDSSLKIKKESPMKVSPPKTRKITPPNPRNEIIKGRFTMRDASESPPKIKKESPPKPMIIKKKRFKVLTRDPSQPQDNNWVLLKNISPPKTRKITPPRFTMRAASESPPKIKKESPPKPIKKSRFIVRNIVPPLIVNVTRPTKQMNEKKQKNRFTVKNIDPYLVVNVKQNHYESPPKTRKVSPPKTRKITPPKPKNEIKKISRFKVRDISPPK